MRAPLQRRKESRANKALVSPTPRRLAAKNRDSIPQLQTSASSLHHQDAGFPEERMPEPTYNFPSVEETTNHPAYKGTVWKLKPHSSGHLPVAKGRGGPLNIYWEVHGTGPTKLILIMGLAGTLTSWQIQTHHFGHVHGAQNSVLVLDNRGVGRSDKPLGRYTTSGMAADVLEVADHIGWTQPRQLNVVGISLGGMVAQELACLAPSRVRSLSLLSTSARVDSGKTLPQAALDRLALLRPKTDAQAIRDTALAVFPPAFLLAPDEVPLPSPGAEPMCAPADTPDGEYPRFGSNFQRFQAQELHKRRAPGGFTLVGFVGQLLAAAGHSKSPAQLRGMADGVGRDRILVMHGTGDKMLVVRNGERLIRLVEPGVAMLVDDLGHAPIFERSVWFNGLLGERLYAWSKL